MGEEACGCGKIATHQCVECNAVACDECATDWEGNICYHCQSENLVFYDKHSRTPGDVDPQHGAAR